jgi:hypothetical protein
MTTPILPVAAAAVVESGVRRRVLSTKKGHAMTPPIDGQQLFAKRDTIRRFIDDSYAAERAALPGTPGDDFDDETRAELYKITGLSSYALPKREYTPPDPTAYSRCMRTRGQVIDALHTFGYDLADTTKRIEALLSELALLAAYARAGIDKVIEAADTDTKISAGLHYLGTCEAAISARLVAGNDGSCETPPAPASQGEQGVGLGAASAWQGLVFSSLLTAAEIAAKLNQPTELVERMLRRFRDSHDYGFVRDDDAGVGESRFRYKMPDVLPTLMKWYKKRQKKGKAPGA